MVVLYGCVRIEYFDYLMKLFEKRRSRRHCSGQAIL
jgi:hypothetical protein